MYPIISKAIITLGLLVMSLTALAADKSDALHDKFDQVLRQHVVEGKVNYDGIKQDPRFFDYLEILKSTNPDTFASEQEKLAYWINAYNALAIKGILDGRSPSSFFGRISYFKTTDYDVGGRSINLYDLERDIIIPFNEPRIHFAIICASMSCPRLISEAYVASQLDEQLEKNTTLFINNPAKNSFDTEKKIARVSKIFDWFEEDFEKDAGTVQQFLARYVKDKALAQALDTYKVKHLDYDWSLNGTFTE